MLKYRVKSSSWRQWVMLFLIICYVTCCWWTGSVRFGSVRFVSVRLQLPLLLGFRFVSSSSVVGRHFFFFFSKLMQNVFLLVPSLRVVRKVSVCFPVLDMVVEMRLFPPSMHAGHGSAEAGNIFQTAIDLDARFHARSEHYFSELSQWHFMNLSSRLKRRHFRLWTPHTRGKKHLVLQKAQHSKGKGIGLMKMFCVKKEIGSEIAMLVWWKWRDM